MFNVVRLNASPFFHSVTSQGIVVSVHKGGLCR